MSPSEPTYVWLTKVGRGRGYVGAEVLPAWRDRNVRIFANLARVVEDEDRIFVIHGAGHAAILRSLVQAAPAFSLVDPLEYL